MWSTLYMYTDHYSHFVLAPTKTHIYTGLRDKEKWFKVDWTWKVKENIWGKIIAKETIDISLGDKCAGGRGILCFLHLGQKF